MTQAEEIFQSFFNEGEGLFYNIKARIISTEITIEHLHPMLARNSKQQLSPYLGFDIDMLPVSEIRTIDLKTGEWSSVNDKPCRVLILDNTLSIEWGTGVRGHVVNHRSTRAGPAHIFTIMNGAAYGLPVPGLRLAYWGRGGRRPDPKKREEQKETLEAQLLPIIESWK